ncbi:MAG: calcium-binding protein [Alphaproteobacteria bacterium]|nr:calcium-binding protein [Alphaproteobacteria bacterium]
MALKTGAPGIDTLTGTGQIDTLRGLDGSDSLIGGAGGDTLLGGAGDDSLGGGAGADSLVDGAGNDDLAGGSGNDVYIVDNTEDTITEAAGAGKDTVRSSVTRTLEANVDDLVLTGTGPIDGTGNADANTLTGAAGNDRLLGDDGDDRLLGGAGDDSLVGGGGNDTAVFSGRFGDYQVDTVSGTTTILDLQPTLGGDDGTDQLTGFERFVFSDITKDVDGITIFAPVNLDDVAAGTGGFKIQGELFADFSGRSVASAGDVNGDGLADLIVGAPGQGDYDAGAAYVVFGKDSDTAAVNLSSVAAGIGGFKIVGESATEEYAGQSVSSAGDVNGDGFDDLIVGAFLNDAGGNAAGAAYLVFGGASGFATVNLADLAAGIGGIKITGEAAIDNAGLSVASAGDVNGDGFDDLTVGAYGNSSVDLYNGAAYVLFGGNLTGAVSHQGTTNADSLTGNTGDNVLVGGLGNDVLDGAAGNDVLIGAGGDDVLVLDTADDLRIDGGTGADTIRLSGSGITLDLTTLNATEHYLLYTNLEAVDLTGIGANTLTLDIQDLFHLSTTSNALRVDGDAGDVVTTSDAGWGAGVADADIAGYTTYSNGQATLIVDSDITQAGIQA